MSHENSNMYRIKVTDDMTRKKNREQENEKETGTTRPEAYM